METADLLELERSLPRHRQRRPASEHIERPRRGERILDRLPPAVQRLRQRIRQSGDGIMKPSIVG
jgi:hypothetical protein